MHTLVLGGARSGKTRHALALAEAWPARTYIATAQAFDDEMRARIARHQEERDEAWTTVEAPLHLDKAIREAANTAPIVVVDCLTLWLTNLMLAEHDVEPAANKLEATLSELHTPVILVSNETGLGIVPDNALARRFRDAQGLLNQQMARACETVVFVAAGLPLTLKGNLPQVATGPNGQPNV